MSKFVRSGLALVGGALMLGGCASAIPANPDHAPPPPSAARPPWRPAPPPAHRQDPGVTRPPVGLEAQIYELWRTFPGRTGIAIRRVGADWAIARRGDEYFPQQSVSKTWVALTLLSLVDAGRINLDEEVTITANDLTLFHQPLAEQVRREGQVRITLRRLLDLAITTSDNSANDALLRRVGGPEAVRRFIDDHQLGRIRFGPGERLLQSHIAGMEWRQNYSVARNFQAARNTVPMSVRREALQRYLADPEDGASPLAITAALAALARGELLSSASTALMLDTLSRVTSGPQRLRAGVPAGWRVAHKTGTGQELGGVATGYNDVAILTAPDGTRYTVAVMLGDTTASVPDRMALMQAVSRAVAQFHGQ